MVRLCGSWFVQNQLVDLIVIVLVHYRNIPQVNILLFCSVALRV